jgi:hypothetical protein
MDTRVVLNQPPHGGVHQPDVPHLGVPASSGGQAFGSITSRWNWAVSFSRRLASVSNRAVSSRT